MKKLIKIGAILFALIIIAIVVVYFMLGSIIKGGVETAGPDLTKGDIKLESASLSIFGSGGIKNLEIGNPTNVDSKFASPFAFKVGSVDIKVQIGTVTSDKIIIDSILIDGAELCWDGMSGDNHKKIMANIEEYIGKDEAPKEEEKKEDGKKVIIKLLKLTNTKVHVYLMGRKLPSLPLPEITKENIGEEEGGASMADTVKEVYSSIFSGVSDLIKTSANVLNDAKKKIGGFLDDATESGKGVIDGAKKAGEGAIEGVKDGLNKLNPFK